MQFRADRRFGVVRAAVPSFRSTPKFGRARPTFRQWLLPSWPRGLASRSVRTSHYTYGKYAFTYYDDHFGDYAFSICYVIGCYALVGFCTYCFRFAITDFIYVDYADPFGSTRSCSRGRWLLAFSRYAERRRSARAGYASPRRPRLPRRISGRRRP